MWKAPAGTGWVTSVTIDCADPEALARFWGRLLGLEVCPRRSRYVALHRPPTETPELVFQPVPEPKQGKARLHLDIAVTDLAAATHSAIELGARVAGDLDNEDDDTLRVLRDPEGNEFCLILRAAGEP
jgi:catechol 2,3-dioxygenase-like lactoylglutathione lyase family enzyme